MNIKLIISIVGFIILTACQNNTKTNPHFQKIEFSETDTNSFNTNFDIVEKSDSLIIDSVLTLEAEIDGDKKWFNVQLPHGYEGVINPDNYHTIHIIPSLHNKNSKNDDYKVIPEMFACNKLHFILKSPFNIGSKKIKIYYNRSKTKRVTSYNSNNGKPDGKVELLTPDANIYLSRTYLNGKWISSTIEPYSVDWTFNQKKSSLEIKDDSRAFSYEGPNEVVSISETMNLGEDNTLYTILQKQSFKDTFKINNYPFSGTLRGYYSQTVADQTNLYYSLHFKNGLLNGNVKIYDGWGELELQEKYVMGKLDSIVFHQNYTGGVANL